MPIVEKSATWCHRDRRHSCIKERCSMWDQDSEDEGYCLEVEVRKAELEIQAHRISAIEEVMPLLRNILKQYQERTTSRNVYPPVSGEGAPIEDGVIVPDNVRFNPETGELEPLDTEDQE